MCTNKFYQIPKIIHYCWFGNNELPLEAKKCIESWRKFFPDYEIKERNESNYDLEVCDYVKEAYKLKKWAFVSDYARFDILYKYGGIYFDTDVEVIKSMDDIISNGPYMGIESGDIDGLVHHDIGFINPGLGMAAPAGLEFYKDVLSVYKKRHFADEYGRPDISETVCNIVTGIFQEKGIMIDGNTAISSGIRIYPKDYFCPKDYETKIIELTENTRSIHHYSATWITFSQKKIHVIEKYFINKYGYEKGLKKSKKYTFIFRVVNKIQRDGLMQALK